MYDFDEVIDRRGTHAMKWDMIAARSGIEADDAIPMWVADMDFRAPPGVTEALREEIERGTHGYYADTGSDRSGEYKIKHAKLFQAEICCN